MVPFCSVTANAQSQTTDIRPKAEKLQGDDLLKAFLGKTYEGAYNFSAEGEPRRFYEEVHHQDSRVTYSEHGESFAGAWTLARDTICYQYRSDTMSGGCFRVYQVGNCYYFYNSARPERPYELGENYWTARSTQAGEIADCEPAVS